MCSDKTEKKTFPRTSGKTSLKAVDLPSGKILVYKDIWVKNITHLVMLPGQNPSWMAINGLSLTCLCYNQGSGTAHGSCHQ